ncbi:hypothetical protein [Corynebacterium sphenisci]|uniref:hypothetical protein n=1 Tax=Corynebacterium sphenisci TaxID=191493 RepID=UPI0026E0CD6B|nr:hypothetical protein [Corynebacterium sphenisci]MDO5730771.1 hypothetical protein [Corynebacterium sphenisci]
MSGQRNPTTDAEWARQVDRRLRALERTRLVTLGRWCVHESPVSGDLVADHIPTGRRIVIAAAEPEQ